MRRFFALLFGLALGTGLLLGMCHTPTVWAQQAAPDEVVKKPLLRSLDRSGFSTAAACTVWYGYKSSSADANKVGVGGKWDFDTDSNTLPAVNDSSQYWRFFQGQNDRDQVRYPLPTDRPWWYFDHGNGVINAGNHELWKARLAASPKRQFRRTGLAGVWHSQLVTSWPLKDGTTASRALTGGGTRAAWCGLLASGDVAARASQTDELTGNKYTSNEQALQDTRGGGVVRANFPGYSNQWDQLLYRDFPYAGSAIALSFRLRAELSTLAGGAIDTGGGGWFDPDPFSPGNFVLNPTDMFQVVVGKVRADGAGSGVYDKVRKYLSDALDYAAADAPVVLYTATGPAVPVDAEAGGDTLVSLSIPGGKASWGSSVRVVFRVKTNRVESDLIGPTAGGGFNTNTGAAMIDNVTVGASVSDFESATSIRPRALLDFTTGAETLIDPATTWITSGRPPANYGHIHAASDLPYDDPCGGLDGSGARLCNLKGNILVMSDHDDALGHKFHRESINHATSPTIAIYPPTGVPGDKSTDQGTPTAGSGQNPQLAGSALNLEFDYFSGLDDPGFAGIFFWYMVDYFPTPTSPGGSSTDPTLNQPGGPKVATWSPFNTPGVISNFGAPTCQVLESDQDLVGFIPLQKVDSLRVDVENQTRCARFFATNCGQTDGSYWDNIRVGIICSGASAPAVNTFPWFLLGDTFTFNESVPPGSTGSPQTLGDGTVTPSALDFDTTTALIKESLNNGRSGGTEGVIVGDTLVYTSPYAGNDARMDLVFRILPGPGNYSTKGVKTSALWKVPSAPGLGTASAGDGSFWGTYMKQTGETNGAVGSKPTGHTATRWDPQTWNSARMDSAQGGNPVTGGQVSPITSRSIGLPSSDTWMGTYHERDEKGGWEDAVGGDLVTPLRVLRPLCFLVNQAGPVDNTNLCCSVSQCATLFSETYPPAGYDPLTPVTTYENNKIIPDGLLTPGSHVSYFVRRSKASVPGTLENMSPDTTTVSFQGGLGSSFDFQRYDHLDVFPDMWKDTRFGGHGLACILYVDAADRRGAEPAIRGALDTLGYGNDDGSERGWKTTAATYGDVDDPAGFVPVNLGQAGLAYDKYDVRASEAGEADRPGCRIVGGGIAPETADRQCKQGPTVDMLDFYYNTVIWSGGDLDNSNATMHDGSGIGQEQSDDAGLINQWLLRAASGNEKAFWATGDGVAQDMANSNGTSMGTLLTNMGGVWLEQNYYDFSGNKQSASVFKPLDADPGAPDPFHSARRYGLFNSCLNLLDIIDRDAGQAGAERAARYEQSSDRGFGGVGPFFSSVYRRLDVGAGRFYASLLDGFSFHRLRGWNGASDPTTTLYGLNYNNHAREAWMDDALAAFGQCARVNPVTAVGDVPGMSMNFVRGTFPNPSVAGAATVQFTLASPAKVTIRFYNVAGRLVHEQTVDGAAGLNSYRWNGVTSTGLRAVSGVYFYRLSAPGVQFQNNSQRMVLLGQAGN